MKINIYTLIIIVGLFNYSRAQYKEELQSNEVLLNVYSLRSSGANIVKDYVFNSLKVRYVKSNIDKILSKAEIDQLNIEIFAKTHPYLQKPVEKLAGLRLKGRMLILKNPEKERVKKMKVVFDKLLQISDMIINAIKKQENIKDKQSVIAVNQLDVYGQKLAIYYALRHIFKDYITDADLQQTMNNFKKSLSILQNLKLQNAQHNQLIKNIQADWEMLEKMVKKNDSNMINIVYMLSNKITNNCQKLTDLFIKKK